MYIKAFRASESPPPKGVPVIVTGGVAVMKTGGEWFTGMEDPIYQRPLEWTPEWWAYIPQNIGYKP